MSVNDDLITACASDNIEAVKEALSRGADINTRYETGATPLLIAAFNNRINIAEFLIANKADINAKDNEGNFPLLEAFRNGYKDFAALLISSNADLTQKDNGGNNLLLAVLQTPRPDIELVKTLIFEGVELNTENKKGETPLSLALKLFTTAIAELLISSGADVNSGKISGNTPLLHCLINNQTRNINIIKLLIAHNADVNAKDVNGSTPLMFALNYNRECIDIVRMLVNKGADVNARDKSGCTPLFLALKWGYLKKETSLPGIDSFFLSNVFKNQDVYQEMAEILISGGADINSGTNEGVPLVFWAATEWGGNRKLIQYLLEKGADISIKDKNGRTPLNSFTTLPLSDLFESSGIKSAEIVRLFISKGADVNTQDNEGNSPLHYSGSNPDVMEALLSAGADLDAKNKSGQDPIDYYKRQLSAKQADEAIELFRKYRSSTPARKDSEIVIRQISSPEDIQLFRSFSAGDLTALIVFRKDASNLRSPSEAEQSMRWMEMALDGRWPENIMPKNHSNEQASNISYRKEKIPAILQDSSVKCDDSFISSHCFMEFENRISGKEYYCVAIFKTK